MQDMRPQNVSLTLSIVSIKHISHLEQERNVQTRVLPADEGQEEKQNLRQ
jgi:hypothetical protein